RDGVAGARRAPRWHPGERRSSGARVTRMRSYNESAAGPCGAAALSVFSPRPFKVVEVVKVGTALRAVLSQQFAVSSSRSAVRGFAPDIKHQSSIKHEH